MEENQEGMNWKNLRNSRCPSDNKPLQWFTSSSSLSCKYCGFQIKESKMQEIVSNLNSEEVKKQTEELLKNDSDPVDEDMAG